MRVLSLAVLLASSLAHANSSITLSVGGEPPDEVRSDPVALSGVMHAAPNNNNLTTNSVAESAADSAAGTMRVYSAGEISPTALNGQLAMPRPIAHVSDQITVMGPPGPVTVSASLEVGGMIEVFPPSQGPGVDCQMQPSVFATLYVGNKQVDTYFLRHFVRQTGMADVDTMTIKMGAGVTVNDSSVGNPGATLTLSDTFTVGKPATVAANLLAQGDIYCGVIKVNYGNTARLTLTLPAGYTFKSDSGVFLTQAGTPGLPLPPDGGMGTSSDLGATGSPSDGAVIHDAAAPAGDASGAPPKSKSSGCSVGNPGGSWVVVALLMAGLCALAVRRRVRR